MHVFGPLEPEPEPDPLGKKSGVGDEKESRAGAAKKLPGSSALSPAFYCYNLLFEGDSVHTTGWVPSFLAQEAAVDDQEHHGGQVLLHQHGVEGGHLSP